MKEIHLSKGYYTIVDDEDYEYLNQWKWTYINGYAGRGATNSTKKEKRLWMHRILTHCPENKEVDHINNNPLDNRKSNLRIATRSQNHMNRTKKLNCYSIHKGITWNKRYKIWQARITINGNRINLGRFKTEKEAANAYNEAAIYYFGDFAKLNNV